MSDFQIVVLGCQGGALESNLSSYLVSFAGGKDYIALDAGSLLTGIQKAQEEGTFTKYQAKEVLVHQIKAYLISHAHLDHILGLVINSQIDGKKKIYGLPTTIDLLRDHIFNGKIWPNCGNEGENALSLYTYERLVEQKRVAIEGTPFSVTPFPLTHAEPYPSTAFLLQVEERALLYFGDTASDQDTKTKRLLPIWQHVAPLIDKGHLKVILLECSNPHSEEARPHFGHLDSHKMIDELRVLRKYCSSLEGLKVVVTHRKQMLVQPDGIALIEKQLSVLNDLGVIFHFPKQGECLTM